MLQEVWHRGGAPVPAARPATARGACCNPAGLLRRCALPWLIGRLACSAASDRVTAAWQLSCLPSWPQYCRPTPTEWVPILGLPVSLTIQQQIGPLNAMTGSTRARIAASKASSDLSAEATKCSRDWCAACTRAGSMRAAIGSTLLVSVRKVSRLKVGEGFLVPGRRKLAPMQGHLGKFPALPTPKRPAGPTRETFRTDTYGRRAAEGPQCVTARLPPDRHA